MNLINLIDQNTAKLIFGHKDAAIISILLRYAFLLNHTSDVFYIGHYNRTMQKWIQNEYVCYAGVDLILPNCSLSTSGAT